MCHIYATSLLSTEASEFGRCDHTDRRVNEGSSMGHEHHDDFGGLHRDLAATGTAMESMNRRTLLRIAAGLGACFGSVQLLGCGGDSPTSPSDASANSGGGTGSTACSRIPAETAGPFPGDGSNGPSVLSLSDVVRTDIRSSFGGLTGTA